MWVIIKATSCLCVQPVTDVLTQTLEFNMVLPWFFFINFYGLQEIMMKDTLCRLIKGWGNVKPLQNFVQLDFYCSTVRLFTSVAHTQKDLHWTILQNSLTVSFFLKKHFDEVTEFLDEKSVFPSLKERKKQCYGILFNADIGPASFDKPLLPQTHFLLSELIYDNHEIDLEYIVVATQAFSS